MSKIRTKRLSVPLVKITGTVTKTVTVSKEVTVRVPVTASDAQVHEALREKAYEKTVTSNTGWELEGNDGPSFDFECPEASVELLFVLKGQKAHDIADLLKKIESDLGVKATSVDPIGGNVDVLFHLRDADAAEKLGKKISGKYKNGIGSFVVSRRF